MDKRRTVSFSVAEEATTVLSFSFHFIFHSFLVFLSYCYPLYSLLFAEKIISFINHFFCFSSDPSSTLIVRPSASHSIFLSFHTNLLQRVDSKKQSDVR